MTDDDAPPTFDGIPTFTEDQARQLAHQVPPLPDRPPLPDPLPSDEDDPALALDGGDLRTPRP